MKVFLLIVLALIIFDFAFSLFFLIQTFKSFNVVTDSVSPAVPFEYYKGYSREEIRIPSGKNILKGHLYGDKDSKALIVFSHGIWSGPNEYLMLIMNLVGKGYRVLTYSYTSYNGSEGLWAKGLARSRMDLGAVLSYVEKDADLNKYPIFLLGHSWGAYATASVLNMGHRVDGAIALSGFDEPMEITMDSGNNMVGKIAYIMYPFIYILEKLFFGKNSNVKAHDAINSVDTPVLIVHGRDDDFIKVDKTAIFAKKDEIKNPNVTYHLITEENACGHNNYIGAKEDGEYFLECSEEIKKLMKQNHGKLTKSERIALTDKYDYERLSSINPELLNLVVSYFDKLLS
jgi:pimeloyl-ACP methyl ester carboxylesterase